MTKLESLGIKKVEALHYYVRDLERSRRFYTEMLDFAEVARSGKELAEAGKQEVGSLRRQGLCAGLLNACGEKGAGLGATSTNIPTA